MFIISNKQMAEMNRRYNERYEALAAIHLSTKYPDWAEQLGPEKIRAFVSDGVKRAERFSITASNDVTAFLEYNLKYSPGFEKKEEHEWAAGILNIRNISGAEKICMMREKNPL